jgi:hypothetical protein
LVIDHDIAERVSSMTGEIETRPIGGRRDIRRSGTSDGQVRSKR